MHMSRVGRGSEHQSARSMCSGEEAKTSIEAISVSHSNVCVPVTALHHHEDMCIAEPACFSNEVHPFTGAAEACCPGSIRHTMPALQSGQLPLRRWDDDLNMTLLMRCWWSWRSWNIKRTRQPGCVQDVDHLLLAPCLNSERRGHWRSIIFEVKVIIEIIVDACCCVERGCDVAPRSEVEVLQEF